MTLLETINAPADLRKLSTSQLKVLANEIREFLTRVVAGNGGHLGPNLGVVELTLALHTVFSSPFDKIIWDVGHQCYVHKLLTGRRDRFETLRTCGGLSGFPKREESEHDAFNTGHSSTSISAALGIALARDLKEEKNKVIAVIGDGALSGGMALEAINHAGDCGTDLIVVLNDNEMSISPNVGAMASYLARVRTDPKYSRLKEEMEQILGRIPAIGDRVVRSAERAKDAFKYLFVSGILFEELGFTYLGPTDGHDIRALQEVLKQSCKLDGPVLVHVVTRKGKGYTFAEQEPERFHGIGPFDPVTSIPAGKNKTPSYTAVFGQTMVELAQRFPQITAITAAMKDGTGLTEFARQFPQRFFDVGIAEQHAVTMAAGMAAGGLRPVVAIYSTFLQRAYDQIIHDVALQNLPVIFAVDRAGLVGEDGETHHGMFDLSFLRQIPNMTVMAPRDEQQLRRMFLTALQLEGPAAFRYPRGAGVGAEELPEITALPVGKGELLCRGKNLVIVAVGSMVYPAVDAAKRLERRGITAAVVDVRFVKPLDEDLIADQTANTGHVLTVEENILSGGLGSAVGEMLRQRGLSGINMESLGIPDKFISHGHRWELLEQLGLTAKGIESAAIRLCEQKVSRQHHGR